MTKDSCPRDFSWQRTVGSHGGSASPVAGRCAAGQDTLMVTSAVGCHEPSRGASGLEHMPGGRIELHIGLLDGIDSPQACADCYATLSPEEKSRAGRFVGDHHRRQYVLAHGLLRFALSSFALQVAPSDWSFIADRYGRPFVAAPVTASPVYFSLSHTDGCVTCAVSDCEKVGVDVERVQARGSLWEVARSTFSVDEIEALRGLPPDDLVDRFFDYWTLKEAYLKARGRGLSLPLDQFSMLISPDEIAIRLMPGMDDGSTRWHFTKRSPSANHRLAIADGSGAAGGLPIVVRHWPPACAA